MTTEKKETKEESEEINATVSHNGIQRVKYPLPSLNADNIYFNISISSDFNNAITLPDYSISSTQTIIQKASEYYLTIVRFNIPAFYIPTLSFVTIPNNPVTGIYSIHMTYDNDISDETNIIANTDHLSSVNTYFNSTSTRTSDNRNIYYLYGYQKFIYWMNQALADCYASLITNYTGISPVLAANPDPPYIKLDSVTKLFTIYFPPIFQHDYDLIGFGNVKLYFNEYLYELFYSFDSIRNTETVDHHPLGIDYQIPCLETELNSNGYYPVTQVYSTLYSWNPFKRILVTSSLLPIRGEFVKGRNGETLKIITDFIPPSSITEQRTSYQYNADQYRLIDLLSDEEIRLIDINVYWEDLYGNLNLFYLQPSSTIEIKLAFFNKELYNHNHLSGYVKL